MSIEIRAYCSDDLDQVIQLIDRSDSTNRTPETWLKNNMTGALAFDGHELIAAIPLEPRRVLVSKEEIINVLWVSAAHVDEGYRSQGLGGRLDQFIQTHFASDFDATMVCRNDEWSAAYRWYEKNGFVRLNAIFALKKQVTSNSSSFKTYSLNQLSECEERFFQCYQKHTSAFGGQIERKKDFWSRRVPCHYYREHYDYTFLFTEDEEACALLGQTNTRDGIDRFDVLEVHASQKNVIGLFNSIEEYASQLKLKEVRFQLSSESPFLPQLRENGHHLRWRTNIMGKFFSPYKEFKKLNSLELQTEKLNPAQWSDETLFMLEGNLQKLLFHRLDMKSNDQDTLSFKEFSFSKSPWVYHQLDYI